MFKTLKKNHCNQSAIKRVRERSILKISLKVSKL